MARDRPDSKSRSHPKTTTARSEPTADANGAEGV
jgi:hypothetical protein